MHNLPYKLHLLNITWQRRYKYLGVKYYVDIMPNIKPVYDLRNYNEVLKDISVGSLVFLTKNGRGKFAI